MEGGERKGVGEGGVNVVCASPWGQGLGGRWLAAWMGGRGGAVRGAEPRSRA